MPHWTFALVHVAGLDLGEYKGELHTKGFLFSCIECVKVKNLQQPFNLGLQRNKMVSISCQSDTFLAKNSQKGEQRGDP